MRMRLDEIEHASLKMLTQTNLQRFALSDDEQYSHYTLLNFEGYKNNDDLREKTYYVNSSAKRYDLSRVLIVFVDK